MPILRFSADVFFSINALLLARIRIQIIGRIKISDAFTSIIFNVMINVFRRYSQLSLLPFKIIQGGMKLQFTPL